MRETIPLKKDILFKTKVSEIVSLDVEHDYTIKSDVVEGKLMLSGTYKMTEASLIEEDFYYDIPFSIAIGDNILKDTINIEIEDFKYTLEKDVMKIDTILEFNCEKIESKEIVADTLKEELNDYFKEDIVINNEESTINTNDTINNITDSILNTEEKYNTYKVYIMREGDTIDTICTKYNVKVEDVKEYNDIDNLVIGDKVIIPYINND